MTLELDFVQVRGLVFQNDYVIQNSKKDPVIWEDYDFYTIEDSNSEIPFLENKLRQLRKDNDNMYWRLIKRTLVEAEEIIDDEDFLYD